MKGTLDKSSWRIGKSKFEKGLTLIGDNPIILKNDLFDDVFKEDLIFPLSRNHTLFHTKTNTQTSLSAESVLAIDLLIYMQSEKYVCGNNENYLLKIAETAQKYENDKTLKDLLKAELFGTIESGK